MSTASSFIAGLFGLSMHLGAHANCTPILNALDKAWQQQRLAQYDVESREQPLGDKPMLVRINKVVWMSMGAAYERSGEPSQNPMASTLRSDAANGAAKCEALDTASYRGQSAKKYRVDGSLGSQSLGRVTLWISAATGLPVFHEFEKLGPGGFAWTYGDAVKDVSKK